MAEGRHGSKDKVDNRMQRMKEDYKGLRAYSSIPLEANTVCRDPALDYSRWKDMKDPKVEKRFRFGDCTTGLAENTVLNYNHSLTLVESALYTHCQQCALLAIKDQRFPTSM